MYIQRHTPAYLTTITGTLSEVLPAPPAQLSSAGEHSRSCFARTTSARVSIRRAQQAAQAPGSGGASPPSDAATPPSRELPALCSPPPRNPSCQSQPALRPPRPPPSPRAGRTQRQHPAGPADGQASPLLPSPASRPRNPLAR